MSVLKFNPRAIVVMTMILVVAALRVATNGTGHLSSLAVFTPIAAMALFGAAHFNGYFKPFAFPLLALFISDVILSFTVLSSFRVGLLYRGWYWTYAAFALMTLAGKFIIKDVAIRPISIAVVTVVLIHWLVSDIGGCLQEKNAAARLAVYGRRLFTAIPYELMFLAATVVYSSIMFGAFEWMQKKHPKLRME